MLTMDVRHPDIEKFIQIKKDLTKVTGANISVMLRDDFMKAVHEDGDYILRFPCTFENTEYMDGLMRENGVGFDEKEFPKIYDQIIPITDVTKTDNIPVVHAKRVKAKQIWDKLIDAAHASAEPGIMFVDKHWNYSPDTVYERYKGITTNP